MDFSIVTPSFRQSDWLKLCVASVADQAPEHEHIVQDAGSDDGTLDWLRSDSRVHAVVERDEGMYDAINRGWRKSQGGILAHLNCDEQYLPGALEAVRDFFAARPELDVLFADAVVVDADGRYLFHRKVQVPLKLHTWTCPLATLTCATFFRRRVLDEMGLFYDPRWRVIGDRDWVLRLIRSGVKMAVMRRFTSVFVNTGKNLSLHPRAQAEERELSASAPAFARQLRPLVLLYHRLRRLAGGIYRQRPFRFEIYTKSNPQTRVGVSVERPTARWRW